MTRTAVGEAEGDGVGKAIGQLNELAQRRRAITQGIEREEAELVRHARTLGLSWQQIASALEISKQAAHKKYGRR